MVKNTVQKRLLLPKDICFFILFACANIFLSFEQKYMLVEYIHIQTCTHLYLGSRIIWFGKQDKLL